MAQTMPLYPAAFTVSFFFQMVKLPDVPRQHLFVSQVQL